MNDALKLNDKQKQKCQQYDAGAVPYDPNSKVAISLNVKQEDVQPLNALRINPQGDTCGWYIWRGEWSNDLDFFKPLHVEHIADWCPEVLPFLQLPPGWRILVAPGREDVWHDPELEL